MAWWDMLARFKNQDAPGGDGGGLPFGGGGGLQGMAPKPPNPWQIAMGAAGGALKGITRPSYMSRNMELIASGGKSDGSKSPNAYRATQQGPRPFVGPIQPPDSEDDELDSMNEATGHKYYGEG